MPSSLVYDEEYRAEVETSDDRVRTRMGWLAWMADDATGAITPSTRQDVLNAFRAASGIQLGVPDPEYTAAVCNSLVARRRDRLEVFEIEATFETKDGTEPPPDDFGEFMDQSQNDSPDNPHGPDYEQYGQFAEEYRAKDLDGKLFVNGAKDALANIPAIPVTVIIDRVSFNHPTRWDTSQQGVADGFRWLYAVKSEQRIHRNKQTGALRKYFRVTLEVWTHPDREWSKVELLNVGFRELVDGEYRTITVGKEKSPLQNPANLDKDGKALPPGAEPETIEFRVLREGQLNIPFL